MDWSANKIFGAVVIIVGLYYFFRPYQVFTYWGHENLKFPWQRSQNLKLRQIKTYIITIKIGGAFAVAMGIFFLLFADTIPNLK